MTDFKNSVLPRNVEVFEDRRKTTEAQALISMVESLLERMDRYDQKLSDHMEKEAADIKASIETALHSSFPQGDPEGHRRAHEAWIKREEDSAKFWAEMRIAVGKWAGLGVLAFLATAAWTQLIKGPH